MKIVMITITIKLINISNNRKERKREREYGSKVHSDLKVSTVLKHQSAGRVKLGGEEDGDDVSRAWLRSSRLLKRQPFLHVATRARGGTELRVYSVLLACSWRMRVGSVTTEAREWRERVKQRVPARGIIALLQIIGQTPTRSERVFRARARTRMCVRVV